MFAIHGLQEEGLKGEGRMSQEKEMHPGVKAGRAEATPALTFRFSSEWNF